MSSNKLINNPIIGYGKEISCTIIACHGKLGAEKHLPKTKDTCFNVTSVTIEYN